MNAPTPKTLCSVVIKHILDAMIKLDDAPRSAEMHLAQAVLMLNQLAEIDHFEDESQQEYFEYAAELAFSAYIP